MKADVRDFCGVLCAVLLIIALLASLTAAQTGSKEMYMWTVVYGLGAAAVALFMLLRM